MKGLSGLSKTDIAFVFGKARVATRKALSISTQLCAVVFLRDRFVELNVLSGLSKIDTAFVFGKTRVATRTALSIPKLELQSVLLASI